MKKSTFKKLEHQQRLFLNKHSIDLICENATIYSKGIEFIVYDIDPVNETIRVYLKDHQSKLLRFPRKDLNSYSVEPNLKLIYGICLIVFSTITSVLIGLLKNDYLQVPFYLIMFFLFFTFNSAWLFKKQLKPKFKPVNIFTDINSVKAMPKHLKLFRKIKPFIVGWSIIASKRIIDVAILFILLKLTNII